MSAYHGVPSEPKSSFKAVDAALSESQHEREGCKEEDGAHERERRVDRLRDVPVRVAHLFSEDERLLEAEEDEHAERDRKGEPREVVRCVGR